MTDVHPRPELRITSRSRRHASGGPGGDTTTAGGSRPIRRGAAVLGPRAVVGGLLLTVATAGAFATYSHADSAPTGRVLVVVHDVHVGDRLSPKDVRVEPAELPDDAAAAMDSADELTGGVALAPLREGDVVQRSAVLTADSPDAGASPSNEFSMPVDRDRALDGRMEPGESVDVLATYGTGEGAFTVDVARRARVIDIAAASAELGTDDRVIVTLALRDADDVVRCAHAGVAAVVTLVRATRSDDDGTLERYSAEADDVTPARP